jgi:cell division septation protein DedD
MDVQHRDKLVYDRFPGGSERSPIEVLNPPPEAPLPPPQRVDLKDPPTQVSVPKVVPPILKIVPQRPLTPSLKDVSSIKKPVPAPNSPAVESVKPITLPKPKMLNRPPPTVNSKAKKLEFEVKSKSRVFVLKSLEKSKQKPLSAAQSVQKPKTNAPAQVLSANVSGKFLVQLAAVRSVERATIEWSRLRRKHPDLLKGLSLVVTKADLGPEKGTFYRLRAGPIAKETEAKTLCTRLSRRKIGCLVVRDG